MPFDFRATVKCAAKRALVVITLFAVIPGIGVVNGALPLLNALSFVALISIVVVAKSLLDVASVQRFAPSVTLTDGRIVVRHGSSGTSGESLLSDVTWTVGNARRSFGLSRAPSQEAIVISYKVPVRHELPFVLWRRVACGWTPESKAILMAFLSIAEVPVGMPTRLQAKK